MFIEVARVGESQTWTIRVYKKKDDRGPLGHPFLKSEPDAIMAADAVRFLLSRIGVQSEINYSSNGFVPADIKRKEYFFTEAKKMFYGRIMHLDLDEDGINQAILTIPGLD